VSSRDDHRGSTPLHATGAVEFVPLEDIAPDETFRLRPDGDVTQLATSLGRLGQLSPIELRPWPEAQAEGPRWQVVSGFRRLAAVRLLARERLLARLHRTLSDEDAWGIALGEALLHEPLTGDELETLREELRKTASAPWAEELVDEALVRAPVAAALRERFYDYLTGLDAPRPAEPKDLPAGEAAANEVTEPTAPGDAPIEVEMSPEELAADLVERLSALNQDLAIAFEAWEDLPTEGRKHLLEQARYVMELFPFMEAKG
jgi:ParB-like nuclease domain